MFETGETSLHRRMKDGMIAPDLYQGVVFQKDVKSKRNSFFRPQKSERTSAIEDVGSNGNLLLLILYFFGKLENEN